MHQDLTRQEVIKVLQEFPEIVELTETRKRAIAGGRASVETALKRMIDDSKRPTVIDKADRERSRAAAAATEESAELKAMRLRQDLIYQARSAATSTDDIQKSIGDAS